MIDSLLE